MVRHIFAAALLLAHASTAAGQAADAEPMPKAVFVRGGDVLSVRRDGTGLTLLATGVNGDATPRWSPDGQRIVYDLPGTHKPYSRTNVPSETHATLVVITAQGQELARYPVHATTPAGEEIGGMRFVEKIGWHSNTFVFAHGTDGPYGGEYQILGGKDGWAGYDVGQFATCPSRGSVAYTGRRPTAAPPTVALDGRTVYTASAGGPDVMLGDIRRSADCERTVFKETFYGESEHHQWLVVIRARTLESRTRLPSNVEHTELVEFGGSFLMVGPTTSLRYDTTSRVWISDAAAARELQREAAARAKLMAELGGTNAAWWVPPTR